MNKRSSWKTMVLVLAVTTVCLAFAVSTSAQVQTTTTKTAGMPTKEVKIESGEVVAVKGNDLFVKMDDGTLRDFPNVPASARVTVNGQQLGIHDLKPGMKLQKTTVTATTPYVVTTVETVTGKVWQVMPPIWVILTLENDTNQKFMIPKDQKFMVDGQETDAWGLRKGMKVTATRITEEPLSATTQYAKVTGTLSADSAVLIAKGGPKPAPAAAGTGAAGAGTAETTTTASTKLPKTGSELPLIGLLGLLSLFASLGLKMLRRV